MSVDIIGVQTPTVNPQAKLKLYGSVAGVPATELAKIGTNATNYTALWTASVHPGAQRVDLLTLLLTSDDSLNLVVRPMSMLPGGRYVFDLCVSANNDAGDAASAAIAFDVNLPPQRHGVDGPTVLAAPQSGMAFATEFELRTTGWVDDDLPLAYRYATLAADATTASTLASNEAADVHIRLQYISDLNVYSSIRARLPAGSPVDDHSVTVAVEVMDAYQLVVRSSTPLRYLQVLPPQLAGRLLSNVSQDLIVRAACVGDLQTIGQIVSSVSSFLNDLSSDSTSNSSTTPTKATGPLTDNNIDSMITREVLTKTLVDIAPVLTEPSVPRMVQLLDTVTQHPSELTSNATDSAIAFGWSGDNPSCDPSCSSR
jgi:hypothetical protein